MKNTFEIHIDNESATIETTDELVAILDVLQGQHDREVLQQLAPDLHRIITNSKSLYKIVSVIQADDQIFLFKLLSNHLIDIIGKGSSLRDLLAFISEEAVEFSLIESLKPHGVQKLIKSAVELAEVLEWVYGSLDKTIIQYLGINNIKKIVKSGRELSLILHAVNNELQEFLLDELGLVYMDVIIHETHDFAYLLRVLPFETSKKLIDNMSIDKIKDIIRTESDLDYINKYLDKKEHEYLKQKLEGLNYAL